jgi:hypothetical protein
VADAVPSRLIPYTPTLSPRLIVCSEGFSGCGKTRLALTMPKPIAFFNLDRFFEDARGDLDLSAVDVGDYSLDDILSRSEAQIMVEAEAIWNDATRDWKQALLRGRPSGKGTYRSVVCDTGTELFQLLRLTRYGRVASIPQTAYPDLYSEFRAKFIKPAFASDCNVLFTHKLKEERTNTKGVNAKGQAVEVSTPTGRYVLDGMKDFRGPGSYAVPINIRQDRDLTLPIPDRYSLAIVKCGPRPELDGLELSGESADFPTLAQLIHPEFPAEYWV